MNETHIIVPGGPLERSKLRLIEPGSTVDVGAHRAAQIQEKTPGRPFSSGMASLSQVSARSNWITSRWYENTDDAPITYYRATWKVPPCPARIEGQRVYLFNGMQPARESPYQTILQPVLEWGRIPDSWTVASYLRPGPDGHTVQTSHVPVSPEQVITGVIQLIDKGDGTFNYQCEFEGIDGTGFCVVNMPELTWCVVTLEAYEPDGGDPPYDLDCRLEYPNTDRTRFRHIRIEADGEVPPLDWVLGNSPAIEYGENAEVVDDSSTNGKVDICYGPIECQPS